MSKKSARVVTNLKVLIARAQAEQCIPGEVYIGHVAHDDWCPAVKAKSMFVCCCKPIIRFEHIPEGSEQRFIEVFKRT